MPPKTHSESGDWVRAYLDPVLELIDGYASRTALFVILVSILSMQILMLNRMLTEAELRPLTEGIILGQSVFDVLEWTLLGWYFAPVLDAMWAKAMEWTGVTAWLERQVYQNVE